MKDFVVHTILFLSLVSANAQKVIQRELDAEGISRLEVVSDQVFLIKIEAAPTNTIHVLTEVEGENYENVVLSVHKDDGTLRIETGYTPYFEAANDKLAAHKVISIEMTLRIPQNLSVFVSSFIASVEAKGIFQHLYTGLNNGNCTLEDFLGSAQLHARHGFIRVWAQAGVWGTAQSQRGHVENYLPKEGLYKVTAQSVNGDVILRPSRE